jgi:hypothetical protein
MKQTTIQLKYEPLNLTDEFVCFAEVYKYSLCVLLKYNWQILQNDNIQNIFIELNNLISETEVKIPDYMLQDHKEAGFTENMLARFDTWYKFSKELGFVYYEIDKPIEFSQSGMQLVKSIESEFAHWENNVFLNAFVKYERNNPFRRVLNTNKPLILLLQTIQELKRIYGNTSAGISRLEIPLLLCWQDSDYKALAILIQHLRAEYGFTPSEDIIYEKCKIMLNVTTARGENRFKKSNIIQEMPDEFIRKMRLTGLISIRGNGRFIDFNNLEVEKIKYCLERYTMRFVEFVTERAYFDYMKEIDTNLVSIEAVIIASVSERKELFQKWVDVFSLESLKEELLIVSNPRGSCKNEVLKFISEPVRFEFLTALSLAKAYPELKVEANYIIDDEGLPTAFAPGGGADIICYDKLGNILFEVTLLTGTQQNIREMPAIQRHLEEIIKTAPDSFCVMICPRVHIDTISYSKWLKDTKNLIVIVLETKTFATSLGLNKNAREYRNT